MWNPFKKAEPKPAANASSAPDASSDAPEPPDNQVLVAAIKDMKLDTLMGDMRPMHRAIIASDLLLPLHEPPRQADGGTILRFMTFNDNSSMCAFTDIERMRAFFTGMPGVGAGVHIQFTGGQELCEMASRSEMALLSINPASDAHYAMPPHVYRVLQHGYVPSSVADEAVRSPQIAIASPMSGLPTEPELQAWREALAEGGARAAWWFNVMLEDVRELRYAIAVECPAERFEALSSALVGAWLGLWPVNTPLWTHHMESDETSQAIRAGGAPIFP